MFTGLIESLGKIENISAGSVRISTDLSDINIGDSVAVNGVCLTATRIKKHGNTLFADFDLSPETGNRTNLRSLKKGGFVNLERALKAGDRMGGHIVSGHIDGLGKITGISAENEFRVFEIEIDEKLMNYVVEKGSIAVDGISLTIAKIKQNIFSSAVIPHTLKNTNLKFLKIADSVNVETDSFAKYAENIMLRNAGKSKMTKEYLLKKGII